MTQLIGQPGDSRPTARLAAPRHSGETARTGHTGARAWLGFAAALALSSACSGVQGPVQETYRLCTERFRIRSVEVDIDSGSVEPDRVVRAREIGLTATVRQGMMEFLTPAGFIETEVGGDTLTLEINAFRLPSVGRWMTGAMKGDDYLGARLSIERESGSVYTTDARARLAAMDRSIGANYSANWALDSLIDMLAFEFAWNLARATGHGEESVLETGKHESVEKALRILAQRGELSVGQQLGYSMMGKSGPPLSKMDEGRPCVPPEVWRRARGQGS